MSSKYVTGLVRFSFVNLFEKRAIGDGEPVYSIRIMIPKSDKEQVKRMESAIQEAVDDGIKSVWKGKLPSVLKKPIRDGDDGAEDYPEQEDMWLITAKSGFEPGVIGRDKQPITDPEVVYNGCWGRVSVIFKAYKNKAGGCGVTTYLQNVQKLKEGEKLSMGTSNPGEDFPDDIEGEEDLL